MPRFRSSPPEALLGKGIQKMCSKFTGEHLFRSTSSIKLQSNLIEITLWHEYSPINLMHICCNLCKAPFHKNISEGCFQMATIRQLYWYVKCFSPQLSEKSSNICLLSCIVVRFDRVTATTLDTPASSPNRTYWEYSRSPFSNCFNFVTCLFPFKQITNSHTLN